MKLTIIALLLSLSVSAQKITDTVVIKMDTTTYKILTALIRENIPANTATQQIILNGILNPLARFTFLQPADKPKPIK